MFICCYCTRCQCPLRVLARYEGKRLRCPGCAAAVVVSADGEAASPAKRAEPARVAQSPPAGGRPVLPWLLLTPTALALVPWMWAGQGVLWAVLGVALGGLCLLLGQRSRWPVSLRVAASLSLALLGHGLTLASPLRSAPEMALPEKDPLHAFSSLPPAQPLIAPLPSGEVSTPSVQRNMLVMDRLRQPPSLRLVCPDLQPAALLGSLLAVSVYARPHGNSIVLITTADGGLKEFSYPHFEPGATYRLQRTAYRAVVDGRRGLLWTAACEPANLRVNCHGDQPLGRADLHVYDIPLSAASGTAATTSLHPRRVLHLAGDVRELLISPNQDALFYLAQDDEGVQLGRIDAERHRVTFRISLPNTIRTLCLTADGKTLYAAGDGSVLALDPTTLHTRKHVDVKIHVRSVAADNDGRVYLAEQGQWTRLTCLDLRGEQPTLLQWTSRMHGRVYLKMAPDQFRLYVGTSSLISDHIDSLLLRDHPWQTPPVTGMAVSGPQTPVQGEFFLTPDGCFLINRWGAAFRLAQGKPFCDRL
ncbi:MAG TPA: hypothetical protein VMG10_16525 [Gemmataceae bacterium]|nr:hypothetical protein [Gemmataceae bacterium]